MQQIIITHDYHETQELGKQFAKSLIGGEVIALHGDLGSGKTTFMQGLAEGLGINKKIISPTFIIVRTYALKSKNFYHIDLYRIEDEKDIAGLGILELMNDPQNIVAIEWAEKIEALLPKKKIECFFEYLGNDKRKIKINGALAADPSENL